MPIVKNSGTEEFLVESNTLISTMKIVEIKLTNMMFMIKKPLFTKLRKN